MSKNLTRKGLAFGAVVALGSTLIAGSPAFAGVNDSSVTFALTSGTSNNFLLASTPTFNANYVAGINIVGGKLSFLIEDASQQVLAVAHETVGTTPATLTWTAGAAVVQADNNTGPNAADILKLDLPSTVTATTSVKVTPWYDSDADKVIDATEKTAETQTVVFNAASSVTATTVLDAPTIGNTSLVAHVSTVPVLNGQQIGNGGVNAAFNFQGSATAFTPADGGAVFNTTTNAWDVTATRTGAITAAAAVSGTASVLTAAANGLTNGEVVTIAGLTPDAGTINGTKTVASAAAGTFSIAAGSATGNVAASSATWTVQVVAGSYSATAKIGTTALGTATSRGVSAAKTADGEVAVVESADLSATNNASPAVTAIVRPTVKSVTATFSFVDADDVAVPAGRPVLLTATTVTAATGVKFNGTAVAANGTVAAETNAAGQVVVVVTSATGVANDVIVVTAVAEGVAASSSAATFTWTPATPALFDVTNSGASLYRSIAVAGSYAFDFAIADQYSALLTGDYRLNVVASGNTVSANNVSISTGRASVTITDARLASGNVTVVVTPQKLQTDGTWSTTNAPSAVTYVLVPSVQTGAAVSITTTDVAGTVTSGVLAAIDARLSPVAAPAVANDVTITGVVSNAITSAVRGGAAVTISGSADTLFVAGSKAAFGSLTVNADENGLYTVDVQSNKAAVDSVITVSSQGATATKKVTFAALGAYDMTVTAPATILPGTVANIVVSVVDKHGNPVSSADSGTVAISATGAGYLTVEGATLAPVAGVYRTKLVTGVLETGTAVIKVVHSVLNAADATDLTKSVSIVVAPAAAAVVPTNSAVIATKAGRVYVTVNSPAGFKSYVKVGFSVKPAFTTTGSKLVSYFVGSGKRVAVRVYVRGGLVASQAITIK